VIELDDLCIRQGAFALENLSFQVPSGAYSVLMGKTGCGKTSVLECVAGLRTPVSGRIRLHGHDVTDLAPGARGLGYVPQDGALFRTMRVRDQLAFALVIRHWPVRQIDERVKELAGWLGLEALLDRFTHGLSGGEAQRIALGRALAFHPRALLLDEPLSSLDEDTRGELTSLLKQLHARENLTVLHVTHSRSEAERLGDVIFRLENGKISEKGP
jgi:molybdate/tungstate transport system ATP-binding protein